MVSRDYHFISNWQIPAAIDTVEAALLNTQDWQTWWQGLEDLKMMSGEVGIGSEFACKWRSMTGYRLSLTVKITHYDKGREIAFDSSGDLVGSGDFMMSAKSDTSTAITIHWNVTTTKPWMNFLGSILKPLFVINHDKLMRQGEIGLAKYVQESHN